MLRLAAVSGVSIHPDHVQTRDGVLSVGRNRKNPERDRDPPQRYSNKEWSEDAMGLDKLSKSTQWTVMG
jgi:hypothetical protein